MSTFQIVDFLIFGADPPPFGLFPLFVTFFPGTKFFFNQKFFPQNFWFNQKNFPHKVFFFYQKLFYPKNFAPPNSFSTKISF